MGFVYFIAVALLALATCASSKPIMVSFGTNQGPIVPPPSTTTQIPPAQDRRAPAPVSESSDDLPNPASYKPLVPQQYRNRLLSFRPNPNLILGTAQDQKYLGSSEKFSLLKRAQASAAGLEYRGPQFFEVQKYELERQRQQPTPNQLFRPILLPYEAKTIEQQNAVPEFGIVYSSGLRYYVPQFGLRESEENSVYDKNEVKYFYYNTQGNHN